jgi:putative transposase
METIFYKIFTLIVFILYIYVVTEHFLSDIVDKYGEFPVSTADGGTWYPQACKFLKLKHHLHSFLEKSIIERTMQYIKDITE